MLFAGTRVPATVDILIATLIVILLLKTIPHRQNPGDLIYVPANWRHMTLNIGESIGVGGQAVYGGEVSARRDDLQEYPSPPAPVFFFSCAFWAGGVIPRYALFSSPAQRVAAM